MRVVTTCTTHYHLRNSAFFPRSICFERFSGHRIFHCTALTAIYNGNTAFYAVRTEFSYVYIGWRCLRRRYAIARLLELRVRIPSGALISVCCECSVLSGRGPYVGFTTRPEETYQVRCVRI